MIMRLHTLRDALLLVGLLPALFGSSALAYLGPPVDPGSVPVLVIAPPWSGGAPELVRAAGGRGVGPLDAPFGILAVFPQGAVTAQDLKNRGAWAVRDAAALASLCGVTPQDL